MALICGMAEQDAGWFSLLLDVGMMADLTWAAQP
jgi:hypothetical protein